MISLPHVFFTSESYFRIQKARRSFIFFSLKTHGLLISLVFTCIMRSENGILYSNPPSPSFLYRNNLVLRKGFLHKNFHYLFFFSVFQRRVPNQCRPSVTSSFFINILPFYPALTSLWTWYTASEQPTNQHFFSFINNSRFTAMNLILPVNTI